MVADRLGRLHRDGFGLHTVGHHDGGAVRPGFALLCPHHEVGRHGALARDDDDGGIPGLADGGADAALLERQGGGHAPRRAGRRTALEDSGFCPDFPKTRHTGWQAAVQRRPLGHGGADVPTGEQLPQRPATRRLRTLRHHLRLRREYPGEPEREDRRHHRLQYQSEHEGDLRFREPEEDQVRRQGGRYIAAIGSWGCFLPVGHDVDTWQPAALRLPHQAQVRQAEHRRRLQPEGDLDGEHAGEGRCEQPRVRDPRGRVRREPPLLHLAVFLRELQQCDVDAAGGQQQHTHPAHRSVAHECRRRRHTEPQPAGPDGPGRSVAEQRACGRLRQPLSLQHGQQPAAGGGSGVGALGELRYLAHAGTGHGGGDGL